jgi:hypothetical protein
MMKEWITRNSTSVQHQHAYTTELDFGCEG